MTITSIVGASYIDHVNDDAPEVDSFSCGCYQALSSPRFEERGWERGYLYSLNIVSSFVATCLASRRAYKPVKEVPDILGGLRACTNCVPCAPPFHPFCVQDYTCMCILPFCVGLHHLFHKMKVWSRYVRDFPLLFYYTLLLSSFSSFNPCNLSRVCLIYAQCMNSHWTTSP